MLLGCRGCGGKKLHTEFSLHTASKRGRNPRCKKCVNAARCKENMSPEEWEKRLAYGRQKYWENPEKERAIVNAWRARDPEKTKRLRAESYIRCKKARDAFSTKYYAEHKAEVDKRHKQRRIELSDGMVRSNLMKLGWDKKHITPELIELKRVMTSLKRESM